MSQASTTAGLRAATSTAARSPRRHPTPPQPAPLRVVSSNVLVTPAIAAEWLAKNKINRKQRPDRIARYAATMKAGHWGVSNDDLCFDPDGYLLNGQHRLLAVIASGCTVDMSIKRNVPRADMAHMDRGAGRTFGDQLSFLGEEYSNQLAASLRLALAIYMDMSASPRDMSGIPDDLLVDFLHEHPNMRHSVAAGHAAAQGTGRVMCSATALAVAHWLICEAGNDQVLADRFLTQLRSRANEPVGSAILAVDNRLRSLYAVKAKHPARDYVLLLLKAWNAWATNKQATKFEMTRRGGQFELPKIERWLR